MKRGTFFLRLSLFSAALTTLDQVTKALADHFLLGKGTIRVAGDFFVLVYARNRGAFLSLGRNTGEALWPWIFIVMPVAVIAAFLFFMARRGVYDGFTLTITTLVVAGGAGNCIDRAIFGSVRDFMNVGIGNLRTGIFNVADMYLMALIAVVILREIAQARPGRKD